MKKKPTAEELLRKIQKLEAEHVRMQRHILDLISQHLPPDPSYSSSSSSSSSSSPSSSSSSPLRQHQIIRERQYANILESMGQAVHMFDRNDRVVYWNQTAQNLYGYTCEDAIGKTVPELIIGPRDAELAHVIIQQGFKGETWSGEFPVRNKHGEKFTVITTLTPCCDETGTPFGVTCVSTDARLFQPQTTISAPDIEPDPHQLPLQLQTAIISKISHLASKVKVKMKARVANLDDHDSYFAPTEGTENRPGLHKVLSLKAEAWMCKKGVSWPWKGNDENRDASLDLRPIRFGWPWFQEQELVPETSSLKLETQLPSNTKETPGSSSLYSCGTSSSSSVTSDSINKDNLHMEYLDIEISWDDLKIRKQIGQGSRGTVYHALLYGSDVAVKIFNEQEYSDDVLRSFKKEVCLMKRLRYPNILLFMGAVVSPQHLCIVTEFLPRGNLFSLLQRSTTKLDWRRRVHMAMDIARGMNYLHHCQPPIIHRNLKSSNLLVDKNWTLKVGDFGLSRIKHETYLATNTGAGTPHWMAPEVLRNEQVDEKSDVYSYGVVLWEITTRKIPWENLNSMQVIGAVGFMNRRLEIPNDVDPQWASLIESCWSREPRSRPTFQEILTQLKDLQKKFSAQFSKPKRENNSKKC